MRIVICVLLFVVLSAQLGFVGAEEPATQVAADAGAKAKAEAEARAKVDVGAKAKPEADAGAKAEADAKAKASPEQPPTATLVEPEADAAGQKAFKMGDTVKIRIEGNHRITVASPKATGVFLVLDDVVMKSIGEPTAERYGVGTGLTLSFRLSRDAENNESRSEWKKLLEKQSGGYLMTLPISLAIGTSAALPVAPSGGFKFYITTAGRLYATLAIGFVIFGVLYWWLVASESALRDYPKGPYSLGKSQMAFWGLLVPLAFAGVWLNTGLIEHIPQQVLILMGISGATGLGALVIGNGTKAAEIAGLEEKLATLAAGDERTRTEARLKAMREPPTPKAKFFRDICDDGNGMSFHRLQTVMWTVILGIIFVSDVARVISMPEFPDTLLVLMGISNSIYLGFKFPEKA